jgi:aldehyde dehydrogenase (NAD+)
VSNQKVKPPVSQSLNTLFLIDGQLVKSRSGEAAKILNPATEQLIGMAPLADAREVDAAIAAARTAFDKGPWPRLSMAERIGMLQIFYNALTKRIDAIKSLLTAEAGSVQWLTDLVQYDVPLELVRFAFSEASKVEARGLPPEVVPPAMGFGASTLSLGAIVRAPYGVVAAITPYNFPFFCNIVKIFPALLMGNTVVVKPSPLTPFMALLIAEAAHDAGLPKGVLNIINAGTEVSQILTTDPRVDLISFTGSDTVGAAIMAQAAPTLKRLVLELGGKSAMIVREDADLEIAASNGIADFTIHTGQGCALSTRHIVHNSVRADYVEMLKGAAEAMQIGDPTDPMVNLGPLISAQQRAKVEHYVQLGHESGGKLITGGKRPAHLDKGYFYEPTIFDGVDNRSRIAQEEIFGPVCTVIGFDTDEEAVAIANDSQFGLAGGVYSRDVGKAYTMAMAMQTGTISINGGGGKVNIYAPFGGFKRSGHGREFGYGWLDEYSQVKSITLLGG